MRSNKSYGLGAVKGMVFMLCRKLFIQLLLSLEQLGNCEHLTNSKYRPLINIVKGLGIGNDEVLPDVPLPGS